jgi:hypothetical protein
MWIAYRFLLVLLGIVLVNLQLALHEGESPWRDFAIRLATRSAPGLAAILALALAVVYMMRPSFRARFESILGGTDSPKQSAESSGRLWNLTGWIVLVGGFVGLQILEPYYFTQDDALVGELPPILLSCRSLWEGVFPDWNPYVFLGSPMAPIGFSGITYPPQLLSYAIARHVLGNECATIEVFAALHLIAGFAAMRHLCRRIGMNAMPANLSAIFYVFAGCILIMGRSWHFFVPNAVWLPLAGIALRRFREGPVGWKWILGVGGLLGLSYHAGFPQIAAILGMFLVLGMGCIALGDRLPLRRLAPVPAALLLGAGLSAPLLLHQLQYTGGLERAAPMEDGIYDDLFGALLPYPLAQTGFPTPWGSVHVEKMGHFYFFGGLFALLFALQAMYFWLYLPDGAVWARSWWVPCGIFALLMVLGEPAFLWRGVAALPMSKLFLRYTIRFYPWLAFCAVLAGGLILERFLAILPRRQRWEWIVGGAMLGVLAYHLSMCRPSFYSYGFRPFPELPAEFESVFHPYDDKSFVGDKNSRRLVSWSQLRSSAPDYYASLPLNMPHYYQAPSILGYDPIIEGQPRMAEVYQQMRENPVNACKVYGVGWHLFSYPEPPVVSPNRRMHTMERAMALEPAYRKLLEAEFVMLAESQGTKLKELAGVDPLAFATERPDRPLPLRLHCRGVDVDVAMLTAGTPVTVNFLWYPHMRLYLDSQPIDLAPDHWQRVTTSLPCVGSQLSLRFEPPWLKTCAVGACLGLVALLLGWMGLRKQAVGADV